MNQPVINGGGGDSSAKQSNGASFAVAAPNLQLPKGGGAIRGIGEKFAANPVTGTGSMSVPIATSPGRSGFGPQLSLSYDSGAGNGPFGFGWSLSIPSITRKTDKGLPQYLDREESDVFILSGAEDLVPEFKKDADGNWVIEDGKHVIFDEPRTVDVVTYLVRRYRPRIEGLFARIERWTNVADPSDVYWRSISKDNILTLYGKDADSRIADPSAPQHIFTWLICETRDDKGNAALYDYKPDDGAGVDLSKAHERNRGDVDDPRRATNRYLKRIHYGNRLPLLDETGRRPPFLTDTQIQNADWMFEVVLDYGEHDVDVPEPDDPGPWTFRDDPFSTYRAGFEVRTTRLCQRVLMFHHFAGEPGVGDDCLVRSTDLTYSHEQDPASVRNPVYTFLLSVTQSGYKRNNGVYLKRSLPPLEYEYTQPIVQGTVQDVDPASLENLSIGVDGASYQWTDLHGEAIPGILTEQAGAWFYKRNISLISERPVEFAPLERVATKPNLALAGGQAQFMDLAGDGQPDLVVLDGPMPGLYEHDEEEGWEPFRPFTSRLNRDMRDSNLKFVDLDGDGHADVLISEGDAFVWHASLAEEGFGPARRVAQALDEEKGPRLVFADSTQSIYLADLSGDGLTDLVRIRNGQVCYWPNVGYCRFGAKVTMDHAPHFDNPDQFDHKRIRLADIDGSGTTDMIYLHRDGVRLYFNQSGNSWSDPETLNAFPRVDNLVSITPTDLLGNGTACLVWSSPLPGDSRRPMRYVDLMGGQKPHLLIKTVNNLGAETVVQYVPSTKFYLQDKRDGKPWITRLPFPVHVVERVETFDAISGNRFVTRYAYHHGYFDGEEREFRGFGRVEELNTEEFAALTADGTLPAATNVDAASHVPPVLTKTWFHTGIYVGRDHVSDFFAGLLDEDDPGEYYREPGLSDAQARELLLPDTFMPPGLTLAEEREACRALKGAMLRQEVYALDDTDKTEIPYTVTEQNFTIKQLQPQDGNRHAVFFTHAREAISYHYERNPDDPRVQHVLTLEVDGFGNVLKSTAIGYGRRQADPALSTDDQAKQAEVLVTYTENGVTNPIDDPTLYPDAYRAPLPCETRTFELTGYTATGAAGRFQSADFVLSAADGPTHIFDAEINYEDPPTIGRQRRLIEQVRILYRPDDLGADQNDPLTPLPLGTLEPLALPGESYKLALTPGLLAHVYQRPRDTVQPPGAPPPENLLPNPVNVLGGQGADRGGYRLSQDLKATGAFPNTDPDDHWWIPAGRVFHSPESGDTAAQELAYARQHFFLPHRFRDPFHTAGFNTESVVAYDTPHALLVRETRDARGNVATAINDYRVLQPRLMTDPNGNGSEVAFDTLGLVVGTALMGKDGEGKGDSLAGFEADLDEPTLLAHLQGPFLDPEGILQQASSRLVYDLFAYQRTRDDPQPQPAVVYTLARETHAADLTSGEQTKVQHSFSYSDGFGREIQKKIQAEPGPLVPGGPAVNPRWVGSGWTVFNNKGKPVRQYEPFFSATHAIEFAHTIGVSPVLFYDPVGRVVATLHPNHTWEKVVFNAWRQESWDVSDTVAFADPKADPDVGDYFRRLPDAGYLPGWYALRAGGALGAEEQAAALKAAVHAATPSVAHTDSLGRTVLTVAHNKFKRSDALPGDPPEEAFLSTRVKYDIEGNQREVIDALERVVMRYHYDLLGTRIHQASMEAGERWMLNDVTGKPLYGWDSRDHRLRTVYDVLRRPTEVYLQEGSAPELLVGKTVYGESQSNPEVNNLRGKPYQSFDGAGVVTTDDYDFKGNLLSSGRQLAVDYKTTPDWSTAVALEVEVFITRTSFDALNRPVSQTTPDNSTIRGTYNEANLIETIDANLRGEVLNGQLVWTPFVTNIDYNAKGQRERIDYGNGVSTTYEYDRLTFRLTHLQTLKGSERLQDLLYTYDPTGNITEIRDGAQQTIYFRNTRVEPSTEYTYDAIYRLIEATGREHLGQIDGKPNLPTAPDAFNLFHTGHDQPGDRNAMGLYEESYLYDAVGNILAMRHRGSDPAHPGWTRAYAYHEASLIEPPDKVSNRLSSTQIGSGPLELYTYDDHGSMTTMPHLPLMRWNYRDHLEATAQQVVNSGTPETTYYVYDAGGQRVRKITERAAGQGETPTRMKERIYLGGFEIYREYDMDSTVNLERETLHLMDGQQRVVLVETRTQGDDGTAAQLIRYQLGNHLGSVSLELDEAGRIISYEEYYPFGCTSYQAVRSQTETPKRYRYTGQERDEEPGLYYHGARYYSPWLGRWTATDPAGSRDGPNPYSYVRGNPLRLVDPSGLAGGDPPEGWSGQQYFSESDAYGVMVTAGWKSRGISPEVRSVHRFAAQMWGQPGPIQSGHPPDRPFVLQMKGEVSMCRPQNASENARQGATADKALRDAAIASGQPVRIRGADPTAGPGGHKSSPLFPPAVKTPEFVDRMSRGIPAMPTTRPTLTLIGGLETMAALPDADDAQLSLPMGPVGGQQPSLLSPAPRKDANPLAIAVTAAQTSVSTLVGEPVGLRSSANWARAGNAALGVTKSTLPEAALVESALAGGAVYAHAYGLTPLATLLEGGTAAMPAVGAGLVAGVVAGNAGELAAVSAGASPEGALVMGAISAALGGAAVGALIGSTGAGVTALPGAAIGAGVGLVGYGLSKFW